MIVKKYQFGRRKLYNKRCVGAGRAMTCSRSEDCQEPTISYSHVPTTCYPTPNSLFLTFLLTPHELTPVS